MRQGIAWTNADPVHWHIYVALGGDELGREIVYFYVFAYLCLFIDNIPEVDKYTHTKLLNNEYVQALMYIILETVLQILIHDDLYIPHSWITAKLEGHNACKKTLQNLL